MEKETAKKPLKTKSVRKKKPASSVSSEETKHSQKDGEYIEAVGRRKTSIARVRLDALGEKQITVNKKSIESYFPTQELQRVVHSPFEVMKMAGVFHVSSIVKGGGIHSQAEAVRHGIARALVEMNPDFRKRLKKAGFLTRDPRMRERKKFGLKRARKAPQWSKR